MADETSVLQYLIGIGLDTKGWSTSAAVMDRTVDQQHKKELERDKQSNASANQYLGIQQASAKEYANEKIATDKLLENAKLRLVQEKLIQEQIATEVTRAKQLAEQQKQNKGGGGLSVGGLANPVVNSAVSALGGSVGLAAVTGGTAGAVMALSHALGEAVGEIKHFILASGPLQQQMELFSTLAKRNGKDAKEWVDELKKATMGLVDDDAMIKVANKVMMQNVGVMPDQLTKLIGLTTRFARVQGMDATQAMETLNRAMLRGRYQMLAMQLGIEKTTIAELRRAEKLPATIRMQEQLNILTKGMGDQLARSSEPIGTYSEALQRLSVSTENMFEAIAEGVTTGSGIGSLMDFLNEISRWIEEHEATFKDVGEDISLVLSTVGSLAETVWSALQTLAVPLDIGNQVAGFDILKTTLVGIAEAAVLVEIVFKEIQLRAQYLADMTKMSLAEATDKFEAAMKVSDAALIKKLENLDAALHPGAKPAEKALANVPKPVDEEFMKKLAKLQVDIDKAALDLQIENQKEALAKKKEANDKAMDDGKITVEEQVAFNKDINNQLLAIDLNKIHKEAEFKKKAIEESDVTAEEEQKQIVALNMQTGLEVDKVKDDYRQKDLAEDRKLQTDKMAAQQKRVADEQQIRNTALAQAEKDLEKSFSRQEVDADKYLDQKRQLIREEQLSAIQAATQKYATDKKTAASETDLIGSVQKANSDARQKNADLDEQAAQVYIKDATERYNREKDLLQSEQQNVTTRSKATKDLITSTEKYIQQLEELAASNVISVGTPEWEQLVKAIQAAKGELAGFNLEIQKTSTSLIGSVENFSSFLSQHQKAGSWRHEALASALGATSMAGNAISGFEGGTGKQFSPGSLASKNLAAAVGESFKDLFSGNDKEGKSIGTFGERLEKVNSVLKDSFTVISAGIQAFQTRGAVQGGIAGAGFGGNVGGMLGSAISALGPWGAVIGAGVGAVVGIFTGHAKAKVDAMADDLTKSFSKVTTALQMGSITLSEAIKQQEALRAKTVADLSTSKEGRKQLKEILPQMDQQINQMLVQQKQTIKNLQDEMAVLNSPEAFQSAVTSIQGIISKYKEYAAAVNDTAQAQDYLNKSVQQYITSQQRDLTTAEKTSIQDAMDLNDQLQARQDLLASTQKQEYDILTQGVLTRQRTSAMTKGSQIAEIQKAADIQLKQMNQQIELSTYKVNAEKQIFSIASTRVDLERQLLILQKQQTDIEMKRLVALQVVSASLKSGASIAELNSLIANFAKIPDSSFQDLLNNQYATQARQGFGGVNGQF